MASKLTGAQRIYRDLKGQILTGKLNPGERIIVSKISESMGTSPMPVREAIKMLQQDGLVDVIPYAGATVKKIDGREYNEISAIRILLEPYAARLAAERMTDAQIEKLQSICDEIDVAVAKGERAGFTDGNLKFHAYINSHCGNQTLSEIINQITEKSKITRQFYLLDEKRISEAQKEHKLIMQYIRERNADAVEELIRQNKIGGHEAILKEITRN